MSHPSRGALIVLVVSCLMPAWSGCQNDHVQEVPQLVEKLSQSDAKVRYEAVKSLGDWGSKAKEAVPAMTALVKDPDNTVRIGAVYALGKVGPEASSAVSAMTAALDDPDSEVRAGAAYSLPALGPQSADAWKTLQRVSARDADPEVRQTAAKSLAKIQTMYKYRQAAEAAAAAKGGR